MIDKIIPDTSVSAKKAGIKVHLPAFTKILKYSKILLTTGKQVTK